MSHSLSQAVRRFPQLLAAPAVAGLLVLLPSARAQEGYILNLNFKDAKEESITAVISGFLGKVALDKVIDSVRKRRGRETRRELLNDISSQVNTINETLAENCKVINTISGTLAENSETINTIHGTLAEDGKIINTISETLAEDGKIHSAIRRIEKNNIIPKINTIHGILTEDGEIHSAIRRIEKKVSKLS